MFHQSLAACLLLSKWICAIALFAACAFFVLILIAQQTSAATFTVTNTADSGAGSLRQAVADANATPAADTINFNIPSFDANCNASGVCTITLTGGVIAVQAAGGALIIANQTGAGRLLISGNNVNRVFEVAEGATLTLDGLTVTRGAGSGTGINTLGVVSNLRGTLTVMNSIFTQNTAGDVILSYAFGTSGTLNVINTTVSNNAGRGIFFSNIVTNGGTMNVVNSTVSNNAPPSGSGGGIYFLGERLTVTNSTISGNSSSAGGGVYVVVSPGTASTSLVALTNCTIANNSAQEGGGIYSFQAPIALTNCTISGNNASSNGGGINVQGGSGVALRNTIVAGNTSAGGTPDFYIPSSRVCSGIVTSRGNNLIGNSTNVGTASCAFWQTSDILNQPARLAPLGNYGGATQTIALLPDSPAINAGNNCVLTANGCGDNNPAVPTDQRGANRVGTVDIGAFEFARRTPFDFDGDGKADISVFRPSNGVWYRLNSSNNSFFGINFGQDGDLITPADFDGDGRTDIAVFRPSNGVWYRLNSSNNQFVAVQFGQAGDVPIPGDFDADGRADIAVFRPSNGVWYRLNSSNNQFTAAQFGQAGDKPQIADFDGDGKTDLSVWRPSNGTWYILRSSDNSFVGIVGQPNDVPVPADYDGDGKTELAMFRPSNGFWYHFNFLTNQFFATQFGTNGDVPVAADYDGDGKADRAIFRPSNGTWYQSRSIAGFFAQQFGISSDIPIPTAFGR